MRIKYLKKSILIWHYLFLHNENIYNPAEFQITRHLVVLMNCFKAEADLEYSDKPLLRRDIKILFSAIIGSKLDYLAPVICATLFLIEELIYARSR